jgi:two-component system chemotaxis response regulator CheB
MSRTRALVVEDSLTVRRRLCEVLSSDPELEVVGEAEDGKRAIERCLALRPDVMTLDMILPVMTGVAATEYIMAHCPTPILIVSASTNRGELFKTYDALAAGAVDVLDKPRGDEPDGEWESRFRAAVKLVSRIKVITHPRARLGFFGRPASFPPRIEARAPSSRAVQVVALGASTGGPGALVEVLSQLPAPFPLPVVIVLHIDEAFGVAFAEWLDVQTQHRVAYPRDGELVASFAGRVAMAAPGQHLVVRQRRFRLTSDPPRHSCRPSVDLLFESLAPEYGASAAACLLTGMGRDGAEGLLEIRRTGGLTIAQDEATSVVYGMPREAVALGAAELVLPLGEIGQRLVELCGVPGGGAP